MDYFECAHRKRESDVSTPLACLMYVFMKNNLLNARMLERSKRSDLRLFRMFPDDSNVAWVQIPLRAFTF